MSAQHPREITRKPFVYNNLFTPEKNLKNRLRIEYLAKRDHVDGAETLALSGTIRNELRAWKEFVNAECVSSYVSIRSEVVNHGTILRLLDAGKKTCIPRVCGDEIKLYKINSLADDLEPGTFGVLEPKIGCEEVPESEPVLHIVPGVVFDLHGNRIGYGKGYYDRFLAKLPPQAITVGLAFDCQLADEIPSEPTDVPLKYLITPRLGVVKCR